VFVGAYGGAVIVFVVGVLLRGVLFSVNSIHKSVELHNRMFKSVIYAVMNFFDTTPIGRVLNAFARHQYAIDAQLADSLMQLLQYMPLCMGAAILCIVVMWPTVGVFGGTVIVAGLLLLFLGGTEEKLRNKEAVTKSTIFSHLTATLEGLFSIRAYQVQERFIDLYEEKIDENHKFMFGMMEGMLKYFLVLYFNQEYLTYFIFRYLSHDTM
jgi:ATP-binding cassette subfamily C (CFTR/MRP) protein 1/ATP-binding cassette subfamily C (CFTR/MRP) protein 2